MYFMCSIAQYDPMDAIESESFFFVFDLTSVCLVASTPCIELKLYSDHDRLVSFQSFDNKYYSVWVSLHSWSIFYVFKAHKILLMLSLTIGAIVNVQFPRRFEENQPIHAYCGILNASKYSFIVTVVVVVNLAIQTIPCVLLLFTFSIDSWCACAYVYRAYVLDVCFKQSSL